MEETRLQSYLNQELSTQEQSLVESALQEDKALAQTFASFKQEDEALQTLLQKLPETPTLSPEKALARFHQKREQGAAKEIQQTPSAPKNPFFESWNSLLRWIQGPVGLSTAVGFAAFMLLFQTPKDTTQWRKRMERAPQKRQVVFAKRRKSVRTRKPVLRAKNPFQAPSQRPKELFLHIGYQRASQKMKRLGSGDSCLPGDKLGFLFTLKTRGYPYLFLIEKGRSQLLYPFSLKDLAIQGKGSHEVARNGTPQLYELTGHSGNIRFILLKTQKPLSAKSLEALQGTKHAFQKSANVLQLMKQRYPALTIDQVVLNVKEKAGSQP